MHSSHMGYRNRFLSRQVGAFLKAFPNLTSCPEIGGDDEVSDRYAPPPHEQPVKVGQPESQQPSPVEDWRYE